MADYGLTICEHCQKQQRGHYPPLGSCYPTRRKGTNSTFSPKKVEPLPVSESSHGRACQYIIAYEYRFEHRNETYAALCALGYGYHFGRLPSSLYQGVIVNTEVVHCTFDYDALGIGLLLTGLQRMPWHFPQSVTILERLPGEDRFSLRLIEGLGDI